MPAYAAEDEARVLILNGTDSYLPANLAVDAAMRARLAESPTRRIVYFSESLDTQRFTLDALEAEYAALTGGNAPISTSFATFFFPYLAT